MSINNNAWEVAEAYLAGKLQENELNELKNRLSTDAAFANEFNEQINLISSFEGSGKQKRFRAMLRDIHAKQATASPSKKGWLIKFTPQTWRTAAVAASVALFSSAFTIWSLKPAIKKSDSQYSTISREVETIKKVQAQQQAQQNQLIKDIKNSKPAPPPSDVAYAGTGFALTNDGYFVTANHVIHHNNKGDFDSVYIQTHDGQYFKATLINYDAGADIAILKVEKKNFHFGKGEVPYTFAADKSGLGARIFTLGYPKDEVVYKEGYISSKNGFDGNDMQYTLELPVSHGQSGSPVMSANGTVLGILTGVGSEQESSTYAVSSKVFISKLLHELPDNTLHLPKVNKMAKLDRDEQIKKMEAYTFSVKVYKK
ncbi:MAG: serine protease [Flavipsychrobacter sp.]|nr:serine protease [Flavipsychrobacter sp.]